MQNIADILTDRLDDGRVTRKEVADAADCSVQTVGRWLSGELEPALEHCRRMASPTSLLPIALQRAVAAWVLKPTRFRPEAVEPPDRTRLDANGDGIVDCRDTVALSLGGIGKAAEAADTLKAAVCNGRASPAEIAAATVTLREARNRIDLALATVEQEVGCRPATNGRVR